MKIKIKGWVAYVEDFYAPNATDEEIQILGNLLADKTVIVIPGQDMTAKEDHEFSGRFGNHDLFSETKTSYPAFYQSIQVYPDAPSVSRVTGALDKNGKPGLHGHNHDLDWHCNRPSQHNRQPIAYLRGVSGVEGSRTSWINGVQAYADLPDEWKLRLQNIKICPVSSYSKYSTLDAEFGIKVHRGVLHGYTPNLIAVNSKGNKSLHFPFLQIEGMLGVSGPDEEQEITEYLKAHMLQEKYMFHLDWKCNDLCMSDQWSGLHKRWAFEGMQTRLVHRVVHDYEKIKFTNDYLSGINVTYEN